MKLFRRGGGWQFYFHDISVDYLVGGFLATPLKNIGQNRSGSSSPIFGWKIKEMFELPPPSHCWWFRNPAGTSWGWSSFPLFTGNSYIPAGAGFLPSTVLIPLVSVNKALWNFSGGGALRWGGWLGWLISHKKKNWKNISRDPITFWTVLEPKKLCVSEVIGHPQSTSSDARWVQDPEFMLHSGKLT